MLEVEVKAPAGPEVREALEARAKRVGTVRQEDVYLEHPSRDLVETDEAVRVRSETGVEDRGEHGTLTYKGPRRGGETKTRVEANVGVDDGEAALEVLEHLGFRRAATVVKHRTRYRWEGWSIVWDEVEGLGSFVEVERLAGPDADIDALEERALEVARDLGAGRPEPRSYLELLQEQGAVGGG